MRFFRFDEIAAAGSCIDFVSSQFGITPRGGRCAAVWRGGNNPMSVSINAKEWYDHKIKQGGGIIELCAVAKFGGVSPASKQKAQEFLGEWLRLAPTYETKARAPKATRLSRLLDDGYHIVRKYDYLDENGNVAHTTTRLEKAGAKKEFVQSSPNSATLEGVRTCLYNLPAVLKAREIWLAEGEKDAETLIGWGLCGTTAPMGAGKWHDHYTEWLRGKDIIIVRDRDDAGLLHARHVAEAILPTVASLRVLCPWRTAKDVTEWAETESGSAARLVAAAAATKPVADVADILDSEAAAVARAKELNREPFRNYTLEDTVSPRGKKDIVRVPRQVNDLVDETFGRFLGFPCRVGTNALFDFDRDTNRIEYFTKHPALFSWIGEKSRQIYSFAKIDGSVSKEEFFEALLRRAPRYENIVRAPYWPPRPDAFLAFREPVKATPGHSALNGFLDFFCPADDATRILLPAFVAAPLYWRAGIQRPSWVIDSADGAGVGKTTLVELVATLYNCVPIRTSMNQLKTDFQELVKNILSAGGRESRIVLVDNATGTVNSDALADMITATSISGRVPYGRGEESRPNDLTFCITANNASLSNDLASRSICLTLARPQSGPRDWKRAVLDYINRNRYGILGDIVATFSAPAPFTCVPRTRCPEFEREVIVPFCATADEYDLAMDAMTARRDAANAEGESGRRIEEAFLFGLPECGVTEPDYSVVFVRQEIVDRWLRDACTTRANFLTCIKSGYVSRFAKGDEFLKYPRSGQMDRELRMPRATGVMWIGDKVNEGNYTGVIVVGRVSAGKFGVVNAGQHQLAMKFDYILDEIHRREMERAAANIEEAQQQLPEPPARPCTMAELESGVAQLPF